MRAYIPFFSLLTLVGVTMVVSVVRDYNTQKRGKL